MSLVFEIRRVGTTSGKNVCLFFASIKPSSSVSNFPGRQRSVAAGHNDLPHLVAAVIPALQDSKLFSKLRCGTSTGGDERVHGRAHSLFHRLILSFSFKREVLRPC